MHQPTGNFLCAYVALFLFVATDFQNNQFNLYFQAEVDNMFTDELRPSAAILVGHNNMQP